MILPNTIIAGAPKCGTSSLFNWLQDHPDACGAKIKELFYLMDADHPLARPDANYHRHGLEGYAPFFASCAASRQKVVFEATTHYIYQRTAVEVLSALGPQPHIIFLLREPAARVFSSFQYGMNNVACFNTDLSFAAFLEAVRNGSLRSFVRGDAGGSAYVLENDISYSHYIRYLQPWLENFDKSRLHVLLLEDLQKDERSVLQNLAQRLQIEPGFYDDYAFVRKNETYAVSQKGVHRQLKKVGVLLPQHLRQGKFKSVYSRLKRAYLQMQSSPKRQIHDDDKKALAELKRSFESDNRKLASAFNLDLSAWN